MLNIGTVTTSSLCAQLTCAYICILFSFMVPSMFHLVSSCPLSWAQVLINPVLHLLPAHQELGYLGYQLVSVNGEINWIFFSSQWMLSVSIKLDMCSVGQCWFWVQEQHWIGPKKVTGAAKRHLTWNGGDPWSWMLTPSMWGYGCWLVSFICPLQWCMGPCHCPHFCFHSMIHGMELKILQRRRPLFLITGINNNF